MKWIKFFIGTLTNVFAAILWFILFLIMIAINSFLEGVAERFTWYVTWIFFAFAVCPIAYAMVMAVIRWFKTLKVGK